jgi:hypothetical protein
MRLILFADVGSSRKTVQELLARSEHRLECRTLDEAATCDLDACDMVLLDGNGRGCAAQDRLLRAAHELRRKLPRAPILIFSSFDAEAVQSARGGCRISTSDDGIWRMHCRLKELAWSETMALVRDALNHDAPEPVLFEYRGS